jgi:hypothetical protein
VPHIARHAVSRTDTSPRQKAGSFNLDRVMEKLLEASNQNK